ncbi:MAG: hypothetical protein ABIK07_15125, partial [Planctomycetota bacterium]
MSGRKKLTFSFLTLMMAVSFTDSLVAQIQRLNESSVGISLLSKRELVQYDLDRVWWGQATVDPHRDRIVHLSLDEINLYALSTSGIITAFDNETGKKLWATQLGRGN